MQQLKKEESCSFLEQNLFDPNINFLNSQNLNFSEFKLDNKSRLKNYLVFSWLIENYFCEKTLFHSLIKHEMYYESLNLLEHKLTKIKDQKNLEYFSVDSLEEYCLFKIYIFSLLKVEYSENKKIISLKSKNFPINLTHLVNSIIDVDSNNDFVYHINDFLNSFDYEHYKENIYELLHKPIDEVKLKTMNLKLSSNFFLNFNKILR